MLQHGQQKLLEGCKPATFFFFLPPQLQLVKACLFSSGVCVHLMSVCPPSNITTRIERIVGPIRIKFGVSA